MPKITDEDLEAVQVRLFKSDLKFLRSMFRGSIGVNKAIRSIVRAYVKQTEAKANKEIDANEAQPHPTNPEDLL